MPVLDLTCLLVTGRSTEPLHDFLGSAEQMSERVGGANSVCEKVETDTTARVSNTGKLPSQKLSLN